MRNQPLTLKKITETASGVWRYNVASKFVTLKPRSLMVNLTYRCNSQCRMCFIWKREPKREMDIEDWQKVIDDDVFKEIRTLTVSGGEAFLYRDYVETVKLFMDKLPQLNRIVLNTNGFLTKTVVDAVKIISKMALTKKIKLVVSVSVDGDQETHDDIRRVQNGFEKAKKTIDELKKLSQKNGFRVSISTLLLSRNIDKMEVMENLWKKWGVDHSFQLIGFHDTYVDNLEEKNNLGFIGQKKAEVIRALDRLKNGGGYLNLMNYYWSDMKNMYKNGGQRTTPCPFAREGLAIDGLGDVYYCLSVKPIGNFLKENRKIGEIYFDKKNLARRKKMAETVCRKCNSGCEVYYGLAYDSKRWWWYRLTGKLWPGGSIN